MGIPYQTNQLKNAQYEVSNRHSNTQTFCTPDVIQTSLSSRTGDTTE